MFDPWGSFVRRRKVRPASSASSGRRLALETLESRRTLTGDLFCTPPPPPPTEPVYFDPSTAPTPPAVVAPPPESPIAAPPTPPTTPAPTNTPPKLTGVTTVQLIPVPEGFLWQVRGVVEDDDLASGVTVKIAGDVADQFASVDKITGKFTLTATVSKQLIEQITLMAIDSGGLVSTEVSRLLP